MLRGERCGLLTPDHSGEEVLEADGGQMGVVHEAEGPSAPVGEGLAETDPDAGALLALGGVGGDAVVGELSLLGSEPAGLQGVVGEEEKGEYRDQDRKGALDDEEPVNVLLVRFLVNSAHGMNVPSPTGQTADTIETSKDAGGNQAREGAR